MDNSTYLLEELASHGYVCAGIDPPSNCGIATLPDGRTLPCRSNDWLNLNTREAWRESLVALEANVNFRVAGMLYTVSILREAPPNALVRDIAAGIAFDRLGAVGHSLGGAAAAAVVQRDPRFLTGANFDGWMTGEAFAKGTGKPFLFALEDDPLWHKNEGPFPDNFDGNARLGTREYHESIRLSLARWGGYLLQPVQAGHGMFADSDLYVRWPFPGTTRKTEVTIRKVHQLIRLATVGLFDIHLKRKGSDFLRGSRETAEYKLSVGNK